MISHMEFTKTILLVSSMWEYFLLKQIKLCISENRCA